MSTKKQKGFTSITGNGHDDLPEKVYELGESLMSGCPANGCLDYLRLWEHCLTLDDLASRLDPGPARKTMLETFIDEYRKLKRLYFDDHDVRDYRRAQKETPPDTWSGNPGPVERTYQRMARRYEELTRQAEEETPPDKQAACGEECPLQHDVNRLLDVLRAVEAYDSAGICGDDTEGEASKAAPPILEFRRLILEANALLNQNPSLREEIKLLADVRLSLP